MKKLLLIAVLIAACLSATAYIACVGSAPAGQKHQGQRQDRHQNRSGTRFRRHRSLARRESRHLGQGVGHPHRSRRQPDRPGGGPGRQGQTRSHPRSKGEQHPERQRHDHRPGHGKIRSLDASSASKIIGETTLKAGKFSIEASSAAKIKAAVEAVSCTIETSSASKVEASIEAESCSLDASSASKIILEGSAGTFRADMKFGIETQRRKILGRQRLDRHIERRQRFDRLQRKTHRQRIERLVGPLLGRLPDFAGKVERRQHPQTLNSETTRQP